MTLRRKLRLSKNSLASGLQNQDGVTINNGPNRVRRLGRVSRLASIESSQVFGENRDNLISLNSPLRNPNKDLSRTSLNRVRMSGVMMSPNLRRIRISKRFSPESEGVLGQITNIKKRASYPNHGGELPEVNRPYQLEDKFNSDPKLLVSSNIM